jgi:hypothetical protein
MLWKTPTLDVLSLTAISMITDGGRRLKEWGMQHSYRVTVSRINEGLHDPPFETMTAQKVTLTADGTLEIHDNSSVRMFHYQTWDSVEIKRSGKPEA